MARLPTDREILRSIYDRYYHDFVSFERDPTTRGTKIYVPIDIPAIAQTLGLEPEIVFGRLHYHLQPKYGRVDGDVRAPFFEVSFPGANPERPERHVINFPLLESVLAELEYEHRKFRLPVAISMLSAAIAVLALLATLATTLRSVGIVEP
jgi:hypothetical protein